jgi:TolA-binding protein
MPVRKSLLPLLSALALGGCYPYWKGTDHEESIVALQGQVEALTEGQRTLRQQQEAKAAELGERIAEVEKRLGESISQLQGGSAERGLEFDKLTQELRELRGELAEIKHKLENAGPLGPVVATAPGSEPTAAAPGAPPLPEDEAGLYRFGWERKRDGNCDDAIRAFTQFATKYPGSKQADNALFLLAECQYAKADYTGSIRSLQAILKSYGQGDKVDDALILMHDDFVALGRCKDAQPFLETLLADYPKSSRAAEAKKKLADTKKSCR